MLFVGMAVIQDLNLKAFILSSSNQNVIRIEGQQMNSTMGNDFYFEINKLGGRLCPCTRGKKVLFYICHLMLIFDTEHTWKQPNEEEYSEVERKDIRQGGRKDESHPGLIIEQFPDKARQRSCYTR